MLEPLLDADRRLLADSAARAFASAADVDGAAIELGLGALALSEEDGGIGTNGSAAIAELALVFAAKGHAYAGGSALASAVLAGQIVAEARDWAPRAHLLAAVAGGAQPVSVALHEPGARSWQASPRVRAERFDGGWRVTGTKALAIAADGAAVVLVTAAIEGGVAVLAVPATAPGLTIARYALRDGTAAADLHFDRCEVSDAAILPLADALRTVAAAVEAVKLCLAAEAAGLARRLVEDTAGYVAERRQFGQAIGAFQAVQHRLADMAVAADQAEALVVQAVSGAVAVDHAHAAVAELALGVAKSAIQLHGGYGITEDLPLGRALRRIMTVLLLY